MADTSLPSIQLPYTGIPLVDSGFTIVSQLLSRTASDLQIALNIAGGGSGGTAAPTNGPVPTGITVVPNSDGSMDVTLTWNYTQGAILADFIVLLWTQGAAALAAPVASDKAILLAVSARVFTFQGWNPNSNYRFAIAAGRKSDATTSIIIGNVSAPTAAPDWADISAAGNYTGTVGGVAAASLVTNAANGQTAFSGTTNYRSAGAPSNNPVPASLISASDTDGSVRYTMGWNYTQGALKADGFFFFVKEGDTASFALTDPHFELGAQNSGTFTASITLKGYPSDRLVSFGVATYRRTELGLEIGPIQTSAASPDWQGVSSGTPNYAGTIFGLEQHNFVVAASGVSATNTFSKVTKDGADLLWTGRDEEFQGGPHGIYGKSYNLTVYDLLAKDVVYQHCFDLFDFGSVTSTGADLLSKVTGGAGTVTAKAVGKFGNAVTVTAPAGTDRAYLATQAASANYNALSWAECWIKRNGNPSQAGSIVAVGQTALADSLYNVPVLRLNVAGTVSGQAYTGAVLRTVTSATVVTDNAWHHVAVGVTAGDVHLWVDGVRTAGGFTGLTSLSMAGPGTLFLVAGYSSAGQLVGATSIDEVVVSTNGTLRATAANFTPPTAETSDWFGGATGTHAIFHLESPSVAAVFTNSRAAPKALGNLLTSYSDYQRVTANKYLFLLAGANEPFANHTADGLTAVLTAIGARTSLLTAASFAVGSAYILVGSPDRGEGNGFEYYAGVTANDPAAHAEIVFQSQGANILVSAGAGIGFTGNGLVAGVPTNNPAASSASVVTGSTGSDIDTIGWTYTQPPLTGTNLLADGFMVYVKIGTSSTPYTSPSATYQVDAASRSFVMEAPFGTSWSFAVAAFRKGPNGVEVGSPFTSSFSPDWQGIGGITQITSGGIGSNQVIDSHIVTVGSTKITGTLTIDAGSSGLVAQRILNSGALDFIAHATIPGRINFKDSGGSTMVTEYADTQYLRIIPSANISGPSSGYSLQLGNSLSQFSFVDIFSQNQTWMFGNNKVRIESNGDIEMRGPDVNIFGELRGCSPTAISATPFSSFMVGGYIFLRDGSTNVRKWYIPLILV